MRIALIHIFALVMIAGCGHINPRWHASYLGNQGVINKVKQDQIAADFGPPDQTRPSADGGQIWKYQTGCEDYVLTFDEQQILRDWKRLTTC